MIKSKLFWAGAILLAVIPLLVMDIPKHYVDWTREVHDETIDAVWNSYNFTKQQRGDVLTHILDSNRDLMAAMYLKGFAGAILLFLSIYFFMRYSSQGNRFFFKPFGVALTLMLCAITLKTYSWYSFNGDDKIKIISYTAADTSLTHLYNTNFKGKVVYVDFWGTTCGPCLSEFRNFTKPLKAKYHNRKDLAYLYISGGHEMVWRQQLKKYDIAGTHLFLDSKQYDHLYRSSTHIPKDTPCYMPRYLIINKQGQIAETDAPRPSDVASISALLDKYLALN